MHSDGRGVAREVRAERRTKSTEIRLAVYIISCVKGLQLRYRQLWYRIYSQKSYENDHEGAWEAELQRLFERKEECAQHEGNTRTEL